MLQPRARTPKSDARQNPRLRGIGLSGSFGPLFCLSQELARLEERRLHWGGSLDGEREG